MNNSENMTDSSIASRDETLARAEVAVQAIILFLTLFGNALVLFVLQRGRKPLSRMQLFISHLSLVDILVGLFNTTPQMIIDITEYFVKDDFICRFVKYMQIMVMYLSTYALVAATLDRYASICYPIASYTWTMKRFYLKIGVVWSLSLVFSVPQAIIFKIQPHPNVNYNVTGCYVKFAPFWTLRLYVTWFTLSVFIVPLCVIIFSYSKIIRVVYSVTRGVIQSEKRTPRNGNAGPGLFNRNDVVCAPVRDRTCKVAANDNVFRVGHARTLSQSKLKTIKMTFVVVICFVLCWTPWFMCQLWAAFDDNAPFSGPAFTILLLLASLNSCVNPWIYVVFSGFSCRRILILHIGDRRSTTSQTRSTLAERNSDRRRDGTFRPKTERDTTL